MRLEFEPNVAALPFIESEVADETAFSEAERTLRAGIRAAQEGRRNEARNLLLRVTEVNADNETAWLWLASISEYPEELLVFLGHVLKVNPNNERALEWQKATRSLLAKTLVQRGIDATKDERNDFARQCFEQALGHEAENEMAWLWLASVADSEEEKAVCFEKVLSLNPANETARNSLKAIQTQKTQNLFIEALATAFEGDHDAALEMLATILERDPQLEEAWVLKAHLANTFEERAECFLEIRGLNPANEMANAYLSSWRKLAGKMSSKPKAEKFPESFEAPEESFAEVGEVELLNEISASSAGEVFAEPNSKADRGDVEVVAEDEKAVPAVDFGVEESAEFVEPQCDETEYYDQPISVSEEYAHFDTPTQELTFPPDFQEFAPVDQEAAEPAEMPGEVFAREDFSASEAYFESSELVAETDGTEAGRAAELEVEEENMNRAFTEIGQTREAEMAEDSEQDLEFDDDYDDFAGDEEAGEEHFVEISIEPVGEVREEIMEATEQLSEATESGFADYSLEIAESSVENETGSDHQRESQPAESPSSEASSVAETSAEDHQFAPETTFSAATPVDNNFSASVFEELLSLEDSPAAELLVEEKTAAEESFRQPKTDTLSCPFCEAENERQAFVCHSCRTVLTLSDLEMLLGWQPAERETLLLSVEKLELEHKTGGLEIERLAFLGIGHINLKNYREGFQYLQEAAQLNPSNVVLSAQVNALAIRLSEIEKQQDAQEAQPKNRKILVVDDSPTVRKLISGKLEKCGHEVVCAVDGLDALEKVNELQPDLVLLDIAMPRMDGYQVCKMLRNNEATKNVPVVMISGKDGFFDKVRGRMAGTTGYITKPFGPETLMKTVETYL